MRCFGALHRQRRKQSFGILQTEIHMGTLASSSDVRFSRFREGRGRVPCGSFGSPWRICVRLIRRHRARRTHCRAPDAVLTVLIIITRGALRLTNIVFWDGVPIGRTLTVFATTTRWQTKAEVASTATMLADGSSDEDSSACVYEGSSG